MFYNMSKTESHAMDYEDDVSSTSTHESESPMRMRWKAEEEEKDPWIPMVEKAMQQYETAIK